MEECKISISKDRNIVRIEFEDGEIKVYKQMDINKDDKSTTVYFNKEVK